MIKENILKFKKLLKVKYIESKDEELTYTPLVIKREREETYNQSKSNLYKHLLDLLIYGDPELEFKDIKDDFLNVFDHLLNELNGYVINDIVHVSSFDWVISNSSSIKEMYFYISKEYESVKIELYNICKNLIEISSKYNINLSDVLNMYDDDGKRID